MCIAKILEDRKTDNMAEVEHEGGVGRDGTFPFPDASGDLRGAVLRGAATIFFPKPSAIEREAGRTGMIFPSITTLILGLAITGDIGPRGLVRARHRCSVSARV